MSYEYIINKIVTRKYHAYSDDKTKEAQKLFDAYFKAASDLEISVSDSRAELDNKLKAKEVDEIGYRDQLRVIDKHHTEEKKNVDALYAAYEDGVKKLTVAGYEVQNTSGVVYAVVNRYQSSIETEELTELYADVLAAKATFATILIEQCKMGTAKGLEEFIQIYIRGLNSEVDQERLHQAVKNKNNAEQAILAALVSFSAPNPNQPAMTLAEYNDIMGKNSKIIFDSLHIIQESTLKSDHVTETELQLKVDLHKADLAVALLQQKKLEQLINRFNTAYNDIIKERPEMQQPRIIQDLDGSFYCDLLSRDIQAELKNENAKHEKDRDPAAIKFLIQQLEDQALIVEIDNKNLGTNLECNGIETFTIKLEVLGQVINWFVIGEMDQSTQDFRDVIYKTAAQAHALIDGCTGYYRGTNSLHLKRHHTRVEDSFNNHNHYRFDKNVTPDMLRDHMNAIIIQQFGGNILDQERTAIGNEIYMSVDRRKAIVDRIVGEYENFYHSFSIVREPHKAIDMYNIALIHEVIENFMTYAVKANEFNDSASLEDLIYVGITSTLLKNGITPLMLKNYGADQFKMMVGDYKLASGGSAEKPKLYEFSFEKFLAQYSAVAGTFIPPPRGYLHYEALLSKLDGDGESAKISHQEVYNHSHQRKLTPDDDQELKVAQAYEQSCKNQQHNPTRGFGSFMALFRTPVTKTNFSVTESSFFKAKNHMSEELATTANPLTKLDK